MSELLNDLQGAFSLALDADPLLVLVPLVVVAIAQGLRSDGPREVVGNAVHGVLWAGIAIFVIGGLLRADRFDLNAWQVRLGGAWDSLLDLRFIEVMGFWLLILAVSAAIFFVRSVVRR